MLKNGKSRTYRKTGRKVNYRRKTAVKTMPKVNKKAVQTIVKREIARNIENKITGNISTSNSILSVNTDSSGNINEYNFFVFNPVNSGVLNLTQGVQVDQRLGNQIKLKRYVIKGSLYWDPALTTDIITTQYQGYVDLYLGRLLNTSDAMTNQLTALYQNGSADITPQGLILDRTYKINKDQYKIYWHRRYKIGNAGPTVYNNNANYSNNDYKLNVEFGLDVCKYVCKNKIVKYNDNVSVPEDALLSSLCLFAVGTYPNKDVNPSGFVMTDSTLYFPVRTQVTSYCEFEDA